MTAGHKKSSFPSHTVGCQEFSPDRAAMDALVKKVSTNPFLLSAFTQEFLACTPTGWTPLILLFSVNHTLVGAAPLRTLQSLTGRHVDFLPLPWCSDFLFDASYRTRCFQATFDYLFNTLNCKFASFILPAPHPTSRVSDSKVTNATSLSNNPEMGRRLVPLTSTWTEFEATLPRMFKKELRRVERNLSKLGSLTKSRVEGCDVSTITDKIFTVEKRVGKKPGERKWVNRTGPSSWC